MSTTQLTAALVFWDNFNIDLYKKLLIIKNQ